MTVILNPKGYKATKRKRIEHNMDTFERKVGRALNHINAGETTENQFIHEINVAHSNYKHNQRNIYKEED